MFTIFLFALVLTQPFELLLAFAVAHPGEFIVGVGIVASTLNALLPAKVTSGPFGTVLHVVLDRVAFLTRRDAPGTLKWPLIGASILRAVADVFDPPAPPSLPAGVYRASTQPFGTVAPAPHDSRSSSTDEPQRGSSSIAALLVAAAMVVVLAIGAATFGGLAGCRPMPVPTDGAVNVTPSAWTGVARTVLSVLGYAVPGARLILATLPIPEPAKTLIDRALDVVATYAQRLGNAIDAYESRGGDACPAHAAVAGLRSALVDLARVLADNGIALGRPLEQVLDSVASIADQLVEGCDADAGWRSYGVESNDQLRAITRAAESRGVILRRDLDAIRPPADAGAQ